MAPFIKAGYARRNISPPKGIYLIGYGDRKGGNKGIHDELTASALALDDGKNRVVVVACDLLAINEYTLQRVAKVVKENVMICCSHTHSGPIVYASKTASSQNRRYVKYLVQQLVDAINEAVSGLLPASLAWGTSNVDLARNRRERKKGGTIEIGINPEGIVDKSVGILQVKTEHGKPLASIVNLSCHNVILGPSNLMVSADWAGNMRKRIEEATDYPCLFIQGAAADLNPDHEWGEHDFDAVERIGKETASSVLSGFSSFQTIHPLPIKFHESDIWLPLEIEVNSSKPPKTYRKILSKLTHIPSFLVDPILNSRYPWKIDIQPCDGYWAVPLRAIVCEIGELTWVGLGAEVFTDIGLKIKEQIGTPHSIFSSLTNGCIGYLPTIDEFDLGGYEIDLAPYFYRLPGRLQADSELKVLKHTNNIIQLLYGERSE